ITADHGNAETMFNPISAQAHTAHTSKPVPFLYVGNNWQIAHTHGSLIDIAPTVLTVLGLTIPAQMTGKSLLVKN
ncbi:MAG TPA: 2,3-bisphosphoglycerate-independent phosphoglycerate mutase, partial [Legionellales bacterium]|nr:2,3-bisphosphoglycerate-independent phosphoglycerate mutase [Legionellales bacterium]